MNQNLLFEIIEQIERFHQKEIAQEDLEIYIEKRLPIDYLKFF